MKALFMATMRAITASVPLFPGWGSLHFHQNLQKAHGVLTWCLSSCDGPTSANPLRWSLHLVRTPLVPPIFKKKKLFDIPNIKLCCASIYVSSDFAEPLILPSMMDAGPSTSDSTMGAAPISNNLPPEESIAILTSMGFPRSHSIRALKATVSLRPTPPVITWCINIHRIIWQQHNHRQ